MKPKTPEFEVFSKRGPFSFPEHCEFLSRNESDLGPRVTGKKEKNDGDDMKTNLLS